MRIRYAMFVLLCFGFAVLSAACGGSATLSKGEYEAEVRKIDAEVSKTVDESLTPSSADGAPVEADDLRTVQNAVADAADDLDGLDPPKEVSGAHAQMVKGLEQLADAFDEFANALDGAKSNDQRAKVFAQQLKSPKIAEAQSTIEKASALFKDAGYKAFEPAKGESDAATENEG